MTRPEDEAFALVVAAADEALVRHLWDTRTNAADAIVVQLAQIAHSCVDQIVYNYEAQYGSPLGGHPHGELVDIYLQKLGAVLARET